MIQVLGLGAVYAMVLSHGSGLISDGAELLQVVPSLEHLVGSVVLPVLGAVPDGAIILFSGLTGARAQAQEQLSVGVGALAGSTILLLTLPWAMSILAGRVEMGQGRAIYRRPAGWKTAEHGKWTKLRTPLSLRALATTGVSCESAVAESARAMGLTALLYLLIQVPAMTRSWRAITAPTDDASALAVAAFERPYALGACVACTISFVLYLLYKARGATHDVVRTYKVEEARIALIKQGRLTLVGAMAHLVDRLDDARRARARDGGAGAGGAAAPSPADELRGPLVALEAQSAANGVVTTEAAESERADALAEIRDTLRPFFKRYDADGSHSIDVRAGGTPAHHPSDASPRATPSSPAHARAARLPACTRTAHARVRVCARTAACATQLSPPTPQPRPVCVCACARALQRVPRSCPLPRLSLARCACARVRAHCSVCHAAAPSHASASPGVRARGRRPRSRAHHARSRSRAPPFFAAFLPLCRRAPSCVCSSPTCTRSSASSRLPRSPASARRTAFPRRSTIQMLRSRSTPSSTSSSPTCAGAARSCARTARTTSTRTGRPRPGSSPTRRPRPPPTTTRRTTTTTTTTTRCPTSCAYAPAATFAPAGHIR
jgi:hypothetical protein